MKPRLLDLFCCAGGAARGYQRAGFDVFGVDVKPQPNYPFQFVEADALSYVADWWDDYDAIHASPPCQHDSRMTNCRPGLADTYPDLIAATREALEATGLPYVIENVVGSSVRPDLMLCGTMFGKELYRHRLFESNIPLDQPFHPPHVIPASKAGHWRPGTIMSVSGHVSPIAHARGIMGIDWTTRDELAEAIPPYFAEFVGRQLMAHVMKAAA